MVTNEHPRRERLLPVVGLVALVVVLLAVARFGMSDEPSDGPVTGPGTSPAIPSDVVDAGISEEEQRQTERHSRRRNRMLDRELAAKLRDRVQQTVDGLSAAPATFRIASFNVLGYSHTKPGGNKCCRWAGGVARMASAVQLIRGNNFHVVGFQEFEKEQYGAFLSMTGGGWQVYPGLRLGTNPVRNSIAWDTSTFELVSAHTTPIPYFHGHMVPMPYVLLKHRETGRLSWFINIHNPASVRGPAQHWRDLATSREIALMRDLQKPRAGYPLGIPTFLMGDFNEKAEAFCRVTAGANAQAANGGSSTPCRLPGNHGIDWIFGTREGVTFSNYARLSGGLISRTTDHPLIYSDVTLDGDAPWVS
ncbi:hypothetical protein D0Z08_16370 [Nocardioides immobilis]|uniref:Endonuclease/exonuclease/phosphatase domain-containing protein n=1 Tax=Nocardioides immobilis TaxID=2049295 RepID=A0A417XZY4_9ACTN|nr:endonuclease/exonuclease/phosphatase family protein [Nocardioides immobilis]RHW25915.1 hypothetical protein D0Z08_16370 [Nocardioides immobilis]